MGDPPRFESFVPCLLAHPSSRHSVVGAFCLVRELKRPFNPRAVSISLLPPHQTHGNDPPDFSVGPRRITGSITAQARSRGLGRSQGSEVPSGGIRGPAGGESRAPVLESLGAGDSRDGIGGGWL